MIHADQVVNQQSPVADTDNSVSTAASSNPTDSAVVAQLRQAFDAAIACREFTNSSSLVKKALKALEIPDTEARFRKQFRDVAIRNLLSKAAKLSNGTDVPYPAAAAIDTELARLLANRKAKLTAA